MSHSSARRYCTRGLTAVLLVLVVATVLAGGARLGWVAELAAHFRAQYVVILMVLVPVALFMRRRSMAVVALLALMPNLWSAGPYLIPWFLPATQASQMPGSLALVALNLYHGNPDAPAVVRYLEDQQADVLVLSELTPELLLALRPVLEHYPYRMAADQRGPWGLGVFSKFPLLDARGTDLGIRGSFNVMATVDAPGNPVRLAAVHLVSPTSPRSAAMRNLQLERLAELLDRQDKTIPRLLVGDLNTTPFSPYLQDLLARTGMGDARRVQGYLGTWPRRIPLLQIPIDLCITDAAVGVVHVSRGPAVGSDHYPLEVTLKQGA